MGSTSPGRAVVTGAAGFLGRAFAAELVARGWEVHGVDVRPGPAVTIGDVSRWGAWTDLMDGVDLVVHAAAVVGETGDTSTYWRVNVDGTSTVLAAAADAGVARVLHLSSTAVHGRTFADGVDETGPVHPTGNPYTDTTIAAEHQALLAAATGQPVTIIRPGDVYGPHSNPWTVRIVELMRRGLFVLFDDGRGVLSPVYVDDVVAGGLTAAAHPDAVGQVFHLTGGEGVTCRDFFGHYAQMLGVGMRSLPAAAARVITAPVDLFSRGLGRQPPFSPRAIEYLMHPGTYSIAKAEQVLDWRPETSLEDGMALTRAWLVDVGLVPDPEAEEIDDEGDVDLGGDDLEGEGVLDGERLAGDAEDDDLDAGEPADADEA